MWVTFTKEIAFGEGYFLLQVGQDAKGKRSQSWLAHSAANLSTDFLVLCCHWCLSAEKAPVGEHTAVARSLPGPIWKLKTVRKPQSVLLSSALVQWLVSNANTKP